MATSIVSSSKTTWGFSPQSIPGLSLWLDGADRSSMVFSSGSNVSQWNDKSGKGLNVSTAANFPVYTSTGVQFTGGNPLSNTTGGYSATTALNCFVVYQSTLASTRQRVFRSCLNGNSNLCTLDTNFIGSFGTTSVNNYQGPVTYSPNTTSLISLVAYSAASVSWAINGTQSFSWSNPDRASASGVTALAVGGESGVYLTGYIMEVLVFDTYFTDTQRQQVEGYLAAKWGLAMQLPATHPYSAVVPFLPTQIAGCQLWLDAADLTSMTFSPGTSNVTQWNDKSGLGNHCTNSSSTNSPIYTPNVKNGLSALSFTGPGTSGATTTQWLDNTTMVFPNTQNTIFVVAYNNNSTASSFTGNNYIISGRSDELISYSSYTTNLFATFVGSGSSWNDTNTNSPSQNMNGVWSVTGMSILANVLTPYFNGNALSTKNGAMASTTGFVIGDAGAGFRGQCWNGYIAEILIFNTALSTSQRNQVEQYLGQKWKISVANAPSPGRYLIPTNRPFYPTDIPGCTLWLDAADASTVTGTSSVTAWKDKSGNGNNMSLTAGNVSYSSNTITVAGATNMTSSLSVTITANQSFVFIVCRPTYVDLGQAYMLVFPGISGDYTIRFGSTTTLNNYDPNADFGYSNGYYVNGTFYAGGPGVVLTIAGQTNIIGGASTLSGSSVFQLSRATGGRYFYGTIQEVIFYTGPLSLSQRQQVEQYLAQKWGLVANLPPSHPGKLLPAFSTGFTPKAISGCTLWFDGADRTSMTITGTNSVSSWADKSGNGYNATKGTNAPTVLAGGGISFDGTQLFSLATANYSYSQSASTLFLVGKANTSTGQQYFFNFDSTNSGIVLIGNGMGSGTIYLYSGPGNAFTQLAGSGSTNSFIVSESHVSNGTYIGVLNGTRIATPSFSAGGATKIVCLGSPYNTGTDGGNVTIYEFMLFNSFLSDPQRQQVEGYLAWKWGLQSSLPSTHAYAKFSP